MRFSISLVVAGFVLGVAIAVAAIGTARPEPEPVAVVTVSTPSEPATVCVPAPVEERAGQVLLVGLPDVHRGDDARLGRLLEVGIGGFLIADSNVYNAAQVRRLVAGVREGSPYPVLVASDEEPGRISRFTPVLGRFSSPREMAARDSPAEVEVFATQLGTELANLGVDLDFAPVSDVDGGPASSFIGDRAFSGDAREAATYATAFSRGLMAGGVMPGPKYFPGQGRAWVDSHSRRAVVEAPLAELRDADLVPFVRQIELGVPVMMMSHATFTGLDPDLPASLSPAAYALLRELGFEGVAVTDRLGAPSITGRWSVAEATVRAIAAGADAVSFLDGRAAVAARDALVAAVEAGVLDDARLSEAADRVLALKGGGPAAMSCATELRRDALDAVGRKAR